MQLLRSFVLLAFSVPLFAGCGLYLDTGSPAAIADPAARGALATVRLFNCAGVGREGNGIGYPREGYTVSATAEGLIDGHRVSISLEVRRLASLGKSAVFWELPKRGAWLLNFAITNAGPYSIGTVPNRMGALVTVSKTGIDRRPQLVRLPATSVEIDAFLQRSSFESGS